MRLINADVLREIMFHEAFETDTDMQKWDRGCWIRYKMFENALNNVPTIEAELIRKGKWLYYGDYKRGKNYRRCSICRYIQDIHESMNYCPHCGAKMEG